MKTQARCCLAAGGLNAAFAVALGAGGAHALKAVLAANDSANNFALALQYHQFHALGLILLGLVADRLPASRYLAWAGYLMLAGIVLFSGGLYLLSLFGLSTIRSDTVRRRFVHRGLAAVCHRYPARYQPAFIRLKCPPRKSISARTLAETCLRVG